MSALNVNDSKKPGRTSSQRSIYDYPEHLNPFYEDENHKRLRFWKINEESKNSSGKKSSRSNSFSFDGLKGLWSFKSFRLKKKSSTLGINKTSESPPMLRRDDNAYDYNNATLDPQLRHTIDVGLSNNFQRGAAYRNSLQDLNSRDQQVFFVRNHRYRNTVQGGNLVSQTQLRASTPALQTRSSRPPLSRGSSQTSVNSTNPFEDDYVDTVSQAGSVDGLSITRSGRKKRRAPQPPTSPSKNMADKSTTIVEESSSEAADEGRCENSVNIINLTAEIESFVKTASTDSDEKEVPTTREVVLLKQTENQKEMRQSPESNDFYAGDECADAQTDKLTVDKIQNLGAADDFELLNNYERSKRSPVKILIREPTEEDNEIEVASNTKLSNEAVDTNVKDVAEIVASDTLMSGDQEYIEEKDDQAIADHFRKDECNTPTSLEVENILENQIRYSINSTTTSLRITESCDDLSNQVNDDSTSTFDVVNIPLEKSLESPKNEIIPEVKNEILTTTSRFEVRTVPLKNFSPTPIRSSSSEIVTNGTAVKVAPPTPPRRIRTVKEIIESINKSQSLLKINQDNNKLKEKTATTTLIPQTAFTTQRDGRTFDRNLNDLTAKNYYQQKKLFAEVADKNGNRNIFHGDNATDGFDNNDIPLSVARYNEVSRNNSILFKKCAVGRNGNGHSANGGDEKSTNVEWNPVPKPRRHKHSP